MSLATTHAPKASRPAEEATSHRSEDRRAGLRRMDGLAQQQHALRPDANAIFLSRCGPSGAADGAAAFAHATRGPATAIPHKSEMERAFGRSFDGVRAHVGDPAARAGLRALGARGAAQGEVVAFNTATPSKELVAHELTHVEQARGGVHASGVGGPVAGADHDAESEADQVAARVASGRPAGPIGAVAAGIHLDRDPNAASDAFETNLDGTKVFDDEGQREQVGGNAKATGDGSEAAAKGGPTETKHAKDLGDGKVAVTTVTESEGGSERTEVVDLQERDVTGTATAFITDLRADAAAIEATELTARRAKRRKLEQAASNGQPVAAELAAIDAEVARLEKRRDTLRSAANQLESRVTAGDDSLTMEQLRAEAKRVKAGDNTREVYKSTGKTEDTRVDTVDASLSGGVSRRSGAMKRTYDGDGNLVDSSGDGITTTNAKFADGRARGSIQHENADGSSIGGDASLGPNGAGGNVTASNEAGRKVSAGADVDWKKKEGNVSAGTEDASGNYAKGNVKFDAKGNVEGTVNMGHKGPTPQDGSVDTQITASKDKLGTQITTQLPRYGDDSFNRTYKVSGGGSISATVEAVSANPLKYKLNVTISGTFTLGGTVAAKNDAASISATAAYTKALSKAYTRTYDASQTTGELAKFQKLQTAPPSTVEKWAMAMGLLKGGGGELTHEGDANVTEDSDKIELGASGSIDAGALGMSAKASYAGEFKTKLSETLLADGVVRVTVLFAKAQKVTAGAGAKAVTEAEYEYAVSWNNAESMTFDLKKSDPTYANNLRALRNAGSVEELQRIGLAIGSSGWRRSEGKSEKQGAKGGYTFGDETDGVAVGVEANSAETYATDIAMNADTKHISSSGTGAVDAKAGLYVGDADVLSSANTDGGSASSTGEEASLSLDSTAKDTGARTSLDGLGDAVAGSKGVVDLVRNIFTRSQTELSGTSYSSGTVKRLIGRSKDKGVWANAAALGGASGASLSAWGRLRNELRAPRGQNADLYQRIAGSAMKASEKQRLTRELDLANQMSSLNRFLGSTGAIGQACIRSLLEREGQSLYSGGDKKMVGSQYHWPAGSEALKARYEKVPGQVAALQKAIPGLLQEESQETGTTRIKTLQGVVARVVRDFDKARDAHWSEHPEAHADMLAKLRPHRVKVGRILRRFVADHDKRWKGPDMSREEDGEALESRDEQADSRVQAEADERARVDAEEAELRRQYAEDMQNKFRRCNDRCRGFKARERALFKEIRGKWFNKDQRTLCLTSLATMYDGWMGTLKEYRRLYETAQWPAASRNISPKGATNRRNRRLEPNYSGLMKLWQEVFGNTDNNLLYRVRTY